MQVMGLEGSGDADLQEFQNQNAENRHGLGAPRKLVDDLIKISDEVNGSF
jgi:hypothetical protein